MYLLVKIRSYVNELPKCRALIFASPARRHRGMRARNAMEIWKMMVLVWVRRLMEEDEEEEEEEGQCFVLSGSV